MKKLSIFVISALLVLGLTAQVRAEQSPATASGKVYTDNQVFTMAYNNSGADITSNSIVILDTSGTAGSTLGAYITTSTSADNKYVFGVTEDATCSSGTSCRVCIRGPHKVWLTIAGAGAMSAGNIVSQSTTAGRGTTYSQSDGTAGGYLGTALAVTSGTYSYGSLDGNDIWWVWINPQIHK